LPVGHATGHATIEVTLTQPRSTGTVRITGTDPTVAPCIDHRLLTDEHDLDAFDEPWEFLLDLVGKPMFRAAGATITSEARSGRAAALASVGVAGNAAGTCRMGSVADATTVVDARLMVHGTDNVMVADASVFPRLLHTEAGTTCLAIGEIAADLVLGNR
jgi:choline dehydrogenase